MGDDYSLQLTVYWDTIVEQYSTRPLSRLKGFESCGLLDRLFPLGFGKNKDHLLKLMTGSFGGLISSNLRLKHFTVDGNPMTIGFSQTLKNLQLQYIV